MELGRLGTRQVQQVQQEQYITALKTILTLVPEADFSGFLSIRGMKHWKMFKKNLVNPNYKYELFESKL